MTARKNLVGAGLHTTHAEAVLGSIETGMTAAGTTNANAKAITAEVSVFSTVAASTGAILPAGYGAGDVFEVYNRGANALLVYPPAGKSINALTATTAGFSVAAGKGCQFRYLTDSNIGTILGA